MSCTPGIIEPGLFHLGRRPCIELWMLLGTPHRWWCFVRRSQILLSDPIFSRDGIRQPTSHLIRTSFQACPSFFVSGSIRNSLSLHRSFRGQRGPTNSYGWEVRKYMIRRCTSWQSRRHIRFPSKYVLGCGFSGISFPLLLASWGFSISFISTKHFALLFFFFIMPSAKTNSVLEYFDCIRIYWRCTRSFVEVRYQLSLPRLFGVPLRLRASVLTIANVRCFSTLDISLQAVVPMVVLSLSLSQLAPCYWKAHHQITNIQIQSRVRIITEYALGIRKRSPRPTFGAWIMLALRWEAHCIQPQREWHSKESRRILG